VSVAIAGAGTAEHAAGAGAAAAVVGVAVVVAIGAGIGGAGGWPVAAARKRGWAAVGFAGPAVLGTQLIPYVEETAAVVSLLIWLMFGILVVGALKSLTWEMALYTVLSLTVVRMTPVAVSLIGARLGRSALAFVGCSVPAASASVIFALLALEDRGTQW
jgi:sodium/hydrogen antiporter